MGTYSNVSINWIIIGYSTNAASSTSLVKSTNINIPDTTDAGNALKAASSKGQLISTQYLLNAYSNAVGTSEIPAGCVLCLCAGTTGTSFFNNTSPYYSYFPNSDLDTAMTNVYNNIKNY